MTTAHKPTWNSAAGSDEQGGSLRGPVSRMTSSKDLPGYKTLNFRKEGQNAPTDIKARNFREELEEKERAAKSEKRKEQPETLEDGESHKKRRIEAKPEPRFNPEDKDDPDSSSSPSSSDSDSDSDSEEAELLREYEKIRNEREATRQRLEEERVVADRQATADGIMRGNPLLNYDRDDFNVKKKWYDDVVFKHQSRNEPVKKIRFINDTTRNDFHRKFLSKYVK